MIRTNGDLQAPHPDCGMMRHHTGGKKAPCRVIRFASVALALFTAMILTAACGSHTNKAQTLEDYFNRDRDEFEEIKRTAKDNGFEFIIEVNTVKYTYTYEGIELTEEEIKAMAPGLHEQMNSVSESFTKLADDLAKASGIQGVSVKVVFADGAGTEIYSVEYNAGSGSDVSAG